MSDTIIRRLLALISSDAHCHHRRAAASLASAILLNPCWEDRLTVLDTIFSDHFLLNPRWETRTAAALTVELVLLRDAELCAHFVEAWRIPVETGLGDGLEGTILTGGTLRLIEFEAGQVVSRGSPLVAVSELHAKFAFPSPLAA